MTEFLLERIEEDEERVRVPGWYPVDSVRDGYGSRGETCDLCGVYMDEGTEAATERAWGEHLASAHDSARAIAECEAKRQIVNDYLAHDLWHRADPTQFSEGQRRGLVLTLSRMAAVYADHPDYRQEWKR